MFDSGRANGLVFLVMELLRGHDLGAELDRVGPLPPERVARIVRMVAASLAEAHANGIVHRDIKPQNVFLCEQTPPDPERIKVLDFGLAKLTAARDESLAATHAGTVLGTPYYMAPEQIENGDVDHRSDIYSTAALAWCLLTGAPPYRHATALGVLHMHISAPIPRLGDRNNTLAPLDEVFARGLAKRPEQRFDRVEQFAEALASAIDSALGRGGGHELPEWLASATRTRHASVDSSARAMPAERSGFDHADLLGTREEFDRYERILRTQRAGLAFAAVFALALAAGAFFWASGRSVPAVMAEAEPNDDLALANAVAVPATVIGAIRRDLAQPGPDRDVYVVDSVGPQRVVRAHVTAVPGIDLVLELADGTGRYLARSDASGRGGDEGIVAASTPDERAFVVVRGDPNDGAAGNYGTAYTLTIGVRERLEREEREPNDLTEQAMPVVPGQSVVGFVGVPGDADTFALSSAQGEVLAEVTGVAGVDLVLERLDASGTVISVANSAGRGGAERLRVKADAAPATWIRVRAGTNETSRFVYVLTFGAELSSG